jgi:UDP-N-acetylmuramyl pentapeptide phosphotransferase/UDP-N-acetylglucosamine-1-phosphate transferase
MNFYIYLLSSLIFTNLLFIIFYKSITNKINLFDHPNLKRKIHKTKIFLGGGILFEINIIVLIILLSYNNFLEKDYFYSLKSYISFFIIPLFLFIIGYFDDKKNLSANIKLILVSLIIYCAVTIDSDLLITEIKFNTLEKVFYLSNFSTVFSVLCFLLFINAFNMFDGINLQAGVYSFLIFFIFLINNVLPILSIFFLITLSFYIILNYLNKIFLGETGCILISYYISYFFIKSYNIEKAFFADQIILYLLFPGLDLFRLFFYRIINKKNPFAADANHLHHYLLKKYEPVKVFIIIFLAYALPIIVSNLMNNFYLGIIFTIINYSVLLKIYGNKKTALRF